MKYGERLSIPGGGRRPVVSIAIEHRLTGRHRLADLPMTADDWRKVYYAYQGFIHQIRLIADDVIARGGTSAPVTEAPEEDDKMPLHDARLDHSIAPLPKLPRPDEPDLILWYPNDGGPPHCTTFPERCRISPLFLWSPDGTIDTQVTISVRNGRAIYRVVGQTADGINIVLERLGVEQFDHLPANKETDGEETA